MYVSQINGIRANDDASKFICNNNKNSHFYEAFFYSNHILQLNITASINVGYFKN